MHALITGRRTGKTTKFMNWVKAGKPVAGYPGWSRVGVVANRQRHDYIKSLYWGDVEDFDHRVYTLDEIKTGRFPSYDTLYRIDDLDYFLPIFFPGLRLDGFTMTASNWDDAIIDED